MLDVGEPLKCERGAATWPALHYTTIAFYLLALTRVGGVADAKQALPYAAAALLNDRVYPHSSPFHRHDGCILVR